MGKTVCDSGTVSAYEILQTYQTFMV